MPVIRRIALAAVAVLLVAALLGASSLVGGSNAYERFQTNAVSYIPDLPGGAQYVSMGDSYAASGSAAKVQELDFCTRNGDDLGHVLAQRLQPNSFTDRACSGATMDDLTQLSQQSNTSPQLFGVGPFTRLVTIVAGANSMGFGGIMMHCFFEPSAACQQSAEQNLPGTHGWEFVRAQYIGTVDAIAAAAADDVRIVLVGYLPLFSVTGADESQCLARAGINPRNVEYWRAWYLGLEQLIEEVARETGTIYVAPPTGRPACASDPYVALGGSALQGQEPTNNGLHPTVAGQRAVGNLIEDRLRGIADPA